MTKDEAKMMIELLAEMVRGDKELKEFFIQEMSRAVGGQQRRMLSLKEAAAALGKSTSWLYKNKDFFTHEKNGNSKSSTVMFYESKLHEEYKRMMDSRKKIIPMPIENMAL